VTRPRPPAGDETRPDRQIVAELIARTRQAGITNARLAPVLGVHWQTIVHWRAGRYSPRYATAAAWAEYLGMRLAVIDQQGKIIAKGAGVPSRLRELRVGAGLTQADVATRLHVAPFAVSVREGSTGSRGLSTVADHVTALGYRLVLLERR